MPAGPTSYTRALTAEQAGKLKDVLKERGFEFVAKEHALYAASGEKVSIAVYAKGPKVLVQGKGMRDFVQFVLEPEVLGVAELGYEEVNNPEMFEPHFGIDESGKGDFFGPLVVAGAYVNAEIARQLRDAGVMDSKRITSDARIRALAAAIKKIPGLHCYVLSLGPEKYNELYARFKNVNALLAWGHAEVIEVLLRYVPECPRSLSDQFAEVQVLERAISRKEISIQIDQRTKAESDVAVAAASILARERYIDWMDEASRRLGWSLPRGATSVKDEARRFIKEKGAEMLSKAAKVHFRTAAEVLN